jgi:peptidoglycan hydrolase-like protein with peptidoglycan-binding domain
MQRKFRILSAAMAGSLALAVAAISVSSGASETATNAALTAHTGSFPAVDLSNCPILHTRYHGGCVAQLQTDLNLVQGAGLDVDGTFGPLTKQALMAFQRQFGLRADGMSGPRVAMTFSNVLTFGIPSMPAPANYPPTFNPASAAAWALANAATDNSGYPSDPCTEFTSRALQAGGMPSDGVWYPSTDGVDRYVNGGNLSAAWVNANSFTDYAVGNGWARMIPLDLSNPSSALMARPGDLIYYLLGHGNVHMAIATGFSGNVLLMSEKTGDAVTYGADVQWNLAHAHGDVPISQYYPGSSAYLLHWNQSVV